jgi:hypothetical protein
MGSFLYLSFLYLSCLYHLSLGSVTVSISYILKHLFVALQYTTIEEYKSHA